MCFQSGVVKQMLSTGYTASSEIRPYTLNDGAMQLELYYRLHYRFPSKKGSGGGFIKVTTYISKQAQTA
jgi:hypothetical protein